MKASKRVVRAKIVKLPRSLAAAKTSRTAYTLEELIAYCRRRSGRRYAVILSYLLEVKEIHQVTFQAALLRRSVG